MPSTRVLASELGVNPMTISKAWSQLEAEGVLERRPGRPLVVRAVEGAQLRDRRLEQLRASLASAVTAAQQLGIRPDDALRVFEELLGTTRGGEGGES